MNAIGEMGTMRRIPRTDSSTKSSKRGAIKQPPPFKVHFDWKIDFTVSPQKDPLTESVA